MVNRNAGAGTRILIDRLLGAARPAGYGNQPRSHNAVAAAVAQGRADWGVAIEPVARDVRPRLPAAGAGELRFPAGGEPRANGRRCEAFLKALADPRGARTHRRTRHDAGLSHILSA